MSISQGGIFSKQTGKVSGVVFQKARTRYGKKSAVRELVIPANPRTVLQQANRFFLGEVTQALVRAGAFAYRLPWNNQYQRLAGYQSLLRLIRQRYSIIDRPFGQKMYINSAYETVSRLGGLHFPETVSSSPPDRFEMVVTWSTELGENGSPGDRAIVFVLPYSVPYPRDARVQIGVSVSAMRSDGMVALGGLWNTIFASERATILLYFVSDNPRPDHVSRAVWYPSNLPGNFIAGEDGNEL